MRIHNSALAAVLLLALTVSTASAHARLEAALVRLAITYDDPIGSTLSSMALLDGGGNPVATDEVALPGAWHAIMVVPRTNIFDDAQAAFDFLVGPASGAPSF